MMWIRTKESAAAGFSGMCCNHKTNNGISSLRHWIVSLRGAGVDDLGMVLHDQLDQPLLAELTQASLGQRSTNLQPFRHNRWGDQLVGRDLLVQFVVRGLVEQDLVVELVADLSLRPLLLLGLSSGSSLLLLLGLLRLFRRSLGILLRRLQRNAIHRYR